ncbi:hypothetical protein [Rhizobium straminoryzae]|uniref:Uncharacterized protein n=1 Tax=Rhizobium straminoryzae TaxID=1387186 RepID=A0A549TID8_9HYPH|nr:hypothetical protein [Rhizobium straminoryzae]TRL43006.1 hypothetical protein FNA46_00915 [Rhizobium straminoryzae]
MNQISYSVVTGWYADHKIRTYATRGDEFVRSTECFDLWYRCIDAFTAPESILIVDSASPVMPVLPDDPRISVVRLKQNFGHAVQGLSYLCGWSKALLCGLMYGFTNGSDYTVLIEQGSLFYGRDIIERQIAAFPDADIIAPDGRGTPQPLQTGIMIFRSAIIPEFIAAYCRVASADKSLSPEVKCAIAAEGMNLVFSPLPYGRRRPLDFSAGHFFFRHGTTEEIRAFTRHLGWGEHLVDSVLAREAV